MGCKAWVWLLYTAMTSTAPQMVSVCFFFKEHSVVRSLHTEARCDGNIIKRVLWFRESLSLFRSHVLVLCTVHLFAGRWAWSYVHVKRLPGKGWCLCKASKQSQLPQPKQRLAANCCHNNISRPQTWKKCSENEYLKRQWFYYLLCFNPHSFPVPLSLIGYDLMTLVYLD